MKLINMEIPQTLHKRIESCADHVFQGLIPNWVNHGFTETGYSLESLTLDWQPNPVGRVRLLTQCRQLYSLSHATKLGVISGYDAQISKLFNAIIELYFVDDRWIFSRNDDMNILDTQSDAYALAFVMLSFSHYFMLTQDERALTFIERTDQFLDQKMRHPNGGFYEAFPLNEQTVRRQNPHMHLLEGFVAAFEATQAEKYAARIIEICSLAEQYFVDPKTYTLREFFNADLSLDAKTGHLVEPGHHFEWVWLLHQTHRITGRKQDLELAKQLWQVATKYGMSANGGIANSIDGNTFQIVDADKRIWPITEYLKACCVVKLDEQERCDRLENALEFLQTYYFIDHGCWIEYLDANNQSKGFPLPGTTGYHIFLGLAEVLKWRDS